MNRPDRAVLTLALGKPLYVRLALNLARSFRLWQGESDIGFFIVTDQALATADTPAGVSVIDVAPGELPVGFSSKLHLDRIAPADHTLFIDADCLCFGPLDSLFDRFAGRPVSVVGWPVTDGEWFGDTRALLRRFELTQITRFNGGIYYLEPGEAASRVYSRAREIEQSYDALGIVRLRGRPNDELCMAVAMALENLDAVPDDGTVIGDPHSSPDDISVSVLQGRTRLANPPPADPRHRDWYPFGVVHPRIVHFLGDYHEDWRYGAEERKLSLVGDRGWPAWPADLFVDATFTLRRRVVEIGKHAGRPLYHRLFGPRPIKVSDRVV